MLNPGYEDSNGAGKDSQAGKGNAAATQRVGNAAMVLANATGRRAKRNAHPMQQRGRQ